MDDAAILAHARMLGLDLLVDAYADELLAAARNAEESRAALLPLDDPAVEPSR